MVTIVTDAWVLKVTCLSPLRPETSTPVLLLQGFSFFIFFDGMALFPRVCTFDIYRIFIKTAFRTQRLHDNISTSRHIRKI